MMSRLAAEAMMSIIRVLKNKDYFAASNEPFNDKRLSWEARGVMGYLLSKPDDWELSFTDLVNQSSAGPHRIRKILKELKTWGYLVRDKKPDKSNKGKFQWISYIYENPTISRFSIDGEATIYQSTICGKPRDLISTDSIKDIKEEQQNIFTWYQNNIGSITPMMADKLRDAENDYPEPWIKEAFEIAVSNNIRKWSYIQAILDDWRVNGYKVRKSKKEQKTQSMYYEG